MLFEIFSLSAPHRADFRAVITLAVPVVLVQVGMMMMGVVDAMVVGRVSAEALAAVAVGNLYFFGIAIGGIGVLMALEPIIAQAYGAGDADAMRRGLQRGLVIALGLSVAAAALMVPAEPVMRALRQPEEVVPVAARYVHISIIGIAPFFAFVSLRESLQAMGRVRPIVIAIIVANVVNLVLNYAFVFGRLGAPALGVAGSAWATSISRLCMPVLLLGIAWRDFRQHLVPLRRDAFALRPLARMLALGAPIGAQYALESASFAIVAILMGQFGTVQVAAHQIAINLASLTFMVPLGVSGATAVLVGQSIGRGDEHAGRRISGAGLAIAVGFMSATAVAFIGAPHVLSRLYTADVAVVALAATLIPIAGVFQVLDGTQVVSGAVLRGVGDTRAPMIMNLLGYYCFGLPLGLLLAFRLGVGPRGLWWGFVAGLGAVSILHLARIRVRLGRSLVRITI